MKGASTIQSRLPLYSRSTFNIWRNETASKARIDERGRLQIPRAERESASIPPYSEVLVVPKSRGHLELILVGKPRLEAFQEKVKGRLTGWVEGEHRADNLLAKLAKKTRRVKRT